MDVIERLDTPPARHLAQDTRAQQPGALAPKQRAMRYKHYGIWQSYNWQDYLDNVKYLALGLLSLGFEPGDKLLIIGDNCTAMVLRRTGRPVQPGHQRGAVLGPSSAPRSNTSPATRAPGSRWSRTRSKWTRYPQVRDRLPALKTVVYWRYKGLSKQRRRRLRGLPGRDGAWAAATSRASRRVRAERRRPARPTISAPIVYSSGTDRPSQGRSAQLPLVDGGLPLSSTGRTPWAARTIWSRISLLPGSTSSGWRSAAIFSPGGTVDFAENVRRPSRKTRERSPRVWWSTAPGCGRVAPVRCASRMQAASWLEETIAATVHAGRRKGGRHPGDRGERPGLVLLLANALGDLARVPSRARQPGATSCAGLLFLRCDAVG